MEGAPEFCANTAPSYISDLSTGREAVLEPIPILRDNCINVLFICVYTQCWFCIWKFTYLLKLICNPQIITGDTFTVIHGHAHGGNKNLSHPNALVCCWDRARWHITTFLLEFIYYLKKKKKVLFMVCLVSLFFFCARFSTFYYDFAV